MATTGLPHDADTDVSRVTESLEMINPLWNVWILTTLSAQPLRYMEIKHRLPWLTDGTLHPKLRKLAEAGLVERTEVTPGHVTYGLTGRGAELIPVLNVIASWGEQHLEQPVVTNQSTGQPELVQQVPPAQNAQDTLALIRPRYATPILWTLKARGASTAKVLSAAIMPGHRISNIYPQVDRLVDDRLLHKDGGLYELTGSAHALAPVYAALSAWAAGRPLTGEHPLWAQWQTAPHAPTGPWMTTQARTRAPASAAAAGEPALPTRAPAGPATIWKPGDLFSHQAPAHPLALPQSGGPRR
ncbi:helix-turn-helix domain-containing protein [Streptomyces sp. MNP-20]|uniref:winged helix-turn-helix transcriptional regulator n=1 Tax=Streptomyces sp. MNP-20 TaxID=2721165 RepID=UPI0020A69703|nr:helix-turn-helix domain-containing protein [Streptomyces sp. MNP-20]